MTVAYSQAPGTVEVNTDAFAGEVTIGSWDAYEPWPRLDMQLSTF